VPQGIVVMFPMPQMEPCYLCGIVDNEPASWNVIHRDELAVTILNGRQFEIGQCMIVSTRHAPTLLDLTEQEAAAVMSAAQRLMQVMVRAYAPDGVLLFQNNGVGSGQEVPHFHLHVVPRRAGSDWGLGPPHIARFEQSGRPAHLDHASVTDGKLQTVEYLRQYLA
jgi:histidine triad (HIT) family protein